MKPTAADAGAREQSVAQEIVATEPLTRKPGAQGLSEASSKAKGVVGRKVVWTDLGRAHYGLVWALQQRLVEERKAGRGVDRLLLLEHEPVVTLGRRAERSHLLVGARDLEARGISVFEVERGGDVTYHGPGQLVGYPILDLRAHRKDVRWYSGALAAVMVGALLALGVEAFAAEGRETGVWVRAADRSGADAKIGMIGVRIERWITYHGFALNVGKDLSGFETIVPCGLEGVSTTSVSRALGRDVPMQRAREAVLRSFGEVFGVEMVPRGLEGWEVVA
jgi:lipoate-protein ligase B